MNKRNSLYFKYGSIYEGFSGGNNCVNCVMPGSQRYCGLEISQRRDIGTPNNWWSLRVCISNTFRNGNLNTDELRTHAKGVSG